MANSMSSVLKKMNLRSLSEKFEREKITPDLVCKLSLQDLESLGVTSRSDVMALRIIRRAITSLTSLHHLHHLHHYINLNAQRSEDRYQKKFKQIVEPLLFPFPNVCLRIYKKKDSLSVKLARFCPSPREQLTAE